MTLKSNWLKFLLACIIGILLVFFMSYDIISKAEVISYNDWSFPFNISEDTSINNVYSNDYLWWNNSTILQVGFLRNNIIFFLQHIWISNFLISYFFLFWLSFLTYLIYFWLFEKISKSFFGGIFAGTFVLFNNFTIESVWFWWQAYYFPALISFWILFYIVNLIFEGKKMLFSHIFLLSLISLLLALSLHVAIFLMLLGILGVLFFFYKIEKWYYIFYCIPVIFLLHSFWIVPFFNHTFLWANPESVFHWGASWVLDWYKKMATYLNIFSLRQYFNIFSYKIFPYSISYIYYFILLAFIIFHLIVWKKSVRILILPFLLLFLIFFALTLWPNSTLLWNLWLWMWNNISFFQFFRSFTRFGIVLIPILLFLLIFSINNLTCKKIIYSLLIGLTFLAHAAWFTWNLWNSIVSYEIPKQYYQLKSKFKEIDTVLFFPNIDYELYSWSVWKWENGRQDTYFKEHFFTNQIVYDRASLWLKYQNQFFLDLFSLKNKTTLEQWWINYIVIHKDYLNVFTWEKVSYESYQKQVENYGQKILENSYYILYKFDSEPFIFLKRWQIKYKKKSNHIFALKINFKTNSNLYFLQKLDNNWKLYLEPYSKIDCKNSKTYTNKQKKSLENYSVTECESENKFYAWWELSKLWEAPIFDDTHTKVYDYANQWTIDADYIKKNYPKEYYKENPDGSIDIKMTLYFKPQSYFYLGLIISGTTFLLLILWLIIWSIRDRKKKEK